MRKLLLGVGVLALLVPQAEGQATRRGSDDRQGAVAREIGFQEPRPDAALSCACNELQRRISGLEAVNATAKVDRFAQRFPAEGKKLTATQSMVSQALGSARPQLDAAKGKSWADQERICNEGISGTNAAWGEWQGFLSRQGIDSEYFRGIKAEHPTIPSAGDLSDDGRGRVCKDGQWWEEDRAWWAISAREGICEQQRYAVKQLLKGEKGEPGHRCFAYELR